MADQEEDYASLPLDERLVHKVWKVRLGAYEECTKAIQASGDETAACFRPFNSDPDLLVKAVKDANVVAQEAGVGLLLAYLEFAAPDAAIRTRTNVVPALVEKCLGSTRAGTKQKAIDACLLYVELDTGEPVIEDLIPGLSAKLPKLVAATAHAMRQIYAQFGAKTVKAKPAVQVLPKLFSHADKNVRAEALELAVTLYKWLGDAVRPMLLADLKPVQVKELETAFANITVGDVKQERLLRSQQAAQAAQEASGAGSNGAVDTPMEDEPIDAFDLAEPVDVLSKVPGNFDEMMNSAKWKDRKEVLDVVVAASAVPRIREGDFNDVVRMLARCVQKDANVICVQLAANCVENLAKGLKKSFGHYRNVLLSPMGERLKEKKQNVLDSIGAALDALFASTTLDDVLEETLALVKNKNPSVRLNILLFVARSLSTTPVFPRKEEVKALAEGIAPALADTDAKVRDAAAEALGVLMKLVGERAMGPYLEGVDDMRKAKVQEFSQNATTKAKAAQPKPAAAAPAPQARAPGVKKAPAGAIKKGPTLPAAASSASSLNGPPSSPTKVKKAVVSSGYGVSRQSMAKPGLSRTTRPSEVALARPETPKRTLMRPTAQTLHRPSAQPSGEVSNLSAADRAELEQLRQQKREWLAGANDREDLARARAQVQELQIKHANLIDAHAKDAIQDDARAQQLSIVQRDLQATRLQCSRYEREIDLLKAQLASARQTRSTQFDQTPVSISPPPGQAQAHHLGRSITGVANGASSSAAVASLQSSLRLGSEEKENLGASISRSKLPTSALPSPQRSSYHDLPSAGSGNGTGSGNGIGNGSAIGSGPPSGSISAASTTGSGPRDWKNAADLTAKLRERIETMKRNDEARRRQQQQQQQQQQRTD